MDNPQKPKSQHPTARFVLRPTYVPNILKMETVLYSALLIFGATMIGGVLILLLTIMLGLGRIIPFGLGFFAVLVASLVLIPPYIHKTIKANMAATACKFYGDHMLYQTFQWLIFRRRGRVLYRNVADIAERTNIFQARYGVGDIWFIVPGMALEAGQRFSGLKIRNIRLSGDLTDFFETVIFKNTDTFETTDNVLTDAPETEPEDLRADLDTPAHDPTRTDQDIKLETASTQRAMTPSPLLSDVSQTAPQPTGAHLELDDGHTDPRLPKNSIPSQEE